MIGKYFSLCCLILVVLGSESPYLAKVSLAPINDQAETVYFRPLTEQPKISNIKNHAIKLTFLEQQNSCGPLPFVSDDTPTFVIIDVSKLQKLTCGMMQKIAKIKMAGFKGFILVLDNEMFLRNHCRMYQDNHFFTGVMNTGNFSQVMDYQRRGVQSKIANFEVKGSLSIQLFDSSDKLVQIWVNSFNAASYQTLRLLKNAMTKLTTLDQKIQWTPRFATLDCTQGDTAQCKSNDYVASCGCKGAFCSPEIRGKTPMSMVQEDIRQLLLFKQHASKYLQYAVTFAQECLATYQKEKMIEQCSTKVMNKLGIDSYSINEVVNNFLDTCIDDEQIKQSQVYSTLQKDQRAFESYGRYPLVLINKEIIETKSQDDFNGVLCTKMQLDDPGCFQVVQEKTVLTKSTNIAFYIILMLILLAAGAAVVYFYRRRLKRDMNKQIKMQVSTAVEHYFALTDTK